MAGGLFVGLMSGTSVDAVDSALLRCDGNNVELLHTREHPIEPALKSRIAAISHSGPDEIERLGVLDRELGEVFATATNVLLAQAGSDAGTVQAIGSHGQTVRHRPPSARQGDTAFTLQLADPNTIAELTGITTVADFRRRDVAAGGEGAPLAPAFHAAALASAGINRAIVNIGGIANVSLLRGTELSAGFDSGPGNTLLDHWIARHHGAACDLDGQWAAGGQVDAGLLAQLLRHSYLQRSGPRSTGKEAFNLDWLDQELAASPTLAAQDVQATLTEFTAATIAAPIEGCEFAVDEVYICGGGAHNGDLMRRLQARLAPRLVASSAVIGMDPDWVEAATFAWLASRTLAGLPGNAPVVTGARGPRVLGAIYPA
jgi:anhydro-N-acetylmuramic acid kinase